MNPVLFEAVVDKVLRFFTILLSVISTTLSIAIVATGLELY